MAVTDVLTVTHIIEDESFGIEIEFDWNGLIHSHVFQDRAEIVLKYAVGIPEPEFACFMLYSWWLSRDPTAADFDLIRGKTFEFDFATQNQMKVRN